MHSRITFSFTTAMFTRYIAILKFSHFTISCVRILPTQILYVTWRQRPFQDLSESLNIFAARHTVPEICSIFVFWHFANADPYGSSKVKGHHTILSGLTSWAILPVSIMLLRRTVSEIQPCKVLGFELPILTLRGHSRSKVKVIIIKVTQVFCVEKSLKRVHGEATK